MNIFLHSFGLVLLSFVITFVMFVVGNTNRISEKEVDKSFVAIWSAISALTVGVYLTFFI